MAVMVEAGLVWWSDECGEDAVMARWFSSVVVVGRRNREGGGKQRVVVGWRKRARVGGGSGIRWGCGN